MISRADADTLIPRPCSEVVPERIVVFPSVFQDVAVPVVIKGDIVVLL